VTIRDGGLATSSTKVRAWSRGTARLHHIIEPATGLPADSRWRTVSVAAATCADANTASTAAIIRDDRAPGWLASHHLPARLVGHCGEVVTVAGWPADNTVQGSHS
jgi:thiamine biosynthesis lipoprotein